MKAKNLLQRAKIVRTIREFFYQNSFVEIETPVRIPCPALEDYIDAIPASKTYGKAQFLRTSPELHLKRFIAESNGLVDKVFQIGSCFRQGEIGSQHLEEFTMLEWYRTGADYRDIMDDTINLIRHVVDGLGHDITFRQKLIDFSQNWKILTVNEAFNIYSPISAEVAIEKDCFEELLTEHIEPNLGLTQPTFLTDYPASMAALAKISDKDPKVCERWELYIGGLELANCYTELTDADEQRKRFEATAELRERDGRTVYPIDEEFMKSLPKLPSCGGIALGVDRLCMVLTNAETIEEVTFR